MSILLGQLAKKIDGQLHGNPDQSVNQVATLDQAQEGEIAFLFDRGYRKFLKITRATAVVIQQQDLADCPVPAIVTKDPYLAYAKISGLLNQPDPTSGSIHPSAIIAEDVTLDSTTDIGANVVIEAGASIGAHVFIGPGCVIGKGVILGDHSRLVANVTLCHHITIGKRALIHPGAVIGSDGFGLAKDCGIWVKIPQIGSVQIGDDVEIGANTSIDRGAMKDTIIENGVKIDNQIQIAHNVRIGAHTALAGCVGIAGSATIGKRCMLGGGVGIAGHIEVADDVTITGMSLVTKSITKPGVYSSGWPVREAKTWRRTVGRVHRLDSSNKE